MKLRLKDYELLEILTEQDVSVVAVLQQFDINEDVAAQRIQFLKEKHLIRQREHLLKITPIGIIVYEEYQHQKSIEDFFKKQSESALWCARFSAIAAAVSAVCACISALNQLSPH